MTSTWEEVLRKKIPKQFPGTTIVPCVSGYVEAKTGDGEQLEQFSTDRYLEITKKRRSKSQGGILFTSMNVHYFRETSNIFIIETSAHFGKNREIRIERSLRFENPDQKQTAVYQSIQESHDFWTYLSHFPRGENGFKAVSFPYGALFLPNQPLKQETGSLTDSLQELSFATSSSGTFIPTYQGVHLIPPHEFAEKFGIQDCFTPSGIKQLILKKYQAEVN